MGRLALLLVCPVFMMYLFWFDVPSDSVLLGSAFVASGLCVVSDLISARTLLFFFPLLSLLTTTSTTTALKLEFIGIPMGRRNILNAAQAFVQCLFFSYILRLIFGLRVIPFEFLVVCVVAITVGNKIIFGPKVITAVVDPKSKKKMRVSIEPFVDLPKSHRFNPKIDAKLNLITSKYDFSFPRSFPCHIYPNNAQASFI